MGAILNKHAVFRRVSRPKLLPQLFSTCSTTAHQSFWFPSRPLRDWSSKNRHRRAGREQEIFRELVRDLYGMQRLWDDALEVD
jgi:hypothetical protein